MKKLVIGIIIGAVLSFSGQALADSLSKVGKKVQTEYSVVVNGTELPVKAISIDGTSYTPNRAFADATNSDIDFKNNTVILNTNTGDVMEEVIPPTEPTSSEPMEESTNVDVGNFTLETIIPLISNVEKNIDRSVKLLETEATSDNQRELGEARIEEMRKEVERYKAIKAELERRAAAQ